ncbi:hypothetical protein PBY51_005485 [Eleginops maclovinus]|uniref:Uncharacterized protein n=1 Tax=Eleginops maclovinus TaxID=56733 RepID=A0AAN7X6B6_ELEMC|nr:hypothetical protein PBY51_005485 [Eleginops maclovinus]
MEPSWGEMDGCWCDLNGQRWRDVKGLGKGKGGDKGGEELENLTSLSSPDRQGWVKSSEWDGWMKKGRREED